jgi:hypothetical protein
VSSTFTTADGRLLGSWSGGRRAEDSTVPRQKNFKKLVRGRMAKTGESYTTARSRFEPAVPPASPPAPDPEAAPLARALAAAGVANPVTGAPFTEELLFGVGGGIGFAHLVFVYDNWPTTVYVDGRYNALYFEKKGFVETACERLGVPLRVRPLTDAARAEAQLRQALATSPEVALTVELSRLPDAPPMRPMSPRLVTVTPDLTVTGLPRGRVSMSWEDLISARWTHAKKYGGLYVPGTPAGALDVRAAVLGSIARTADGLLAPSSTRFDVNFGVPGIRRWARLLTDPKDKRGWPKLFPDPAALRAALDAVADGLGGPGRSGDAARSRYAAFLDEAAALAGDDRLAGVADTYRDLARRWADLIRLARRPEVTGGELAEPLPDLADAEESAAQALRAAVTATVTTVEGERS